ncbi:ABC transporter permease [Mucilaginibacter angelicae]|uniref:ABC transporter permease n=1 Tax=Mucilaginibacter angelicae TaxID=869718 RepID=A0ABV6L2E5_9SPHI
MFRNYLKIAVRNLQKNIAFSMINIAGLSIGLACCILILLYIKDELSFDRFHAQRQHIYQLTCLRSEQDGSMKKFAIAALVQGPAFKQEIPEIQACIRVNPRDIVIKRGNDVFNEHITWADANFFNVFTFPLLSGNPATVLSDQHAMVLSEESAVKYFGSVDAAAGKTLQLEINGKFEPFIVTGVAKKVPQNSSIQFSIVLPFSFFEVASPDNGWMWVSFPTYFLLSPGADIQNISHKMDQVYRTRAKDEIDLNNLAGYGNHFSWGLQPLTAMHLNTDYEGTPGASDPVYSYILSGIAVFILLIACINFVNLTVAASLKRSKEIGIRKVMGSKRSQLTIQFLGESVIICLIAFILALLLATLALPVFNELANKQLSLSYLVDWKLIAGFAGLFLLTGFSAGFYPALVLSGFGPSLALAGKAGLGGKNVLAKSLVVIQFALATFLIIATLFIYAQFNLLTQTPVGYPDQNLLSFTVSQGTRSKPVMDLYQSEFSKVPGVLNAGYKNVGHFGGKTLAGNKEFTAGYERIDATYLPALGARIIAGRNFSPEFPSDSATSVLINQTLADQMGWKNPIGKTIDYMNFPTWGNRKVTIVGVVKDYHNESLKEKIQPMIFTGESSMPLGQMIVRIRPEHTAATLLAMEKAYHRLNPGHPFQYEFKDEANRRSYEAENKWKQIITFGAIITIFISSIGLFGLAMLSAKKREKEIGVRKVLGASVAELTGMLSRDFGKLVLIAFVIAIPAGWLVMHRWLQNFAYRVDLCWWRFAAAGVITMMVAMLTVSYQAIRAALANPVKSLRNE